MDFPSQNKPAAWWSVKSRTSRTRADRIEIQGERTYRELERLQILDKRNGNEAAPGAFIGPDNPGGHDGYHSWQ